MDTKGAFFSLSPIFSFLLPPFVKNTEEILDQGYDLAVPPWLHPNRWRKQLLKVQRFSAFYSLTCLGNTKALILTLETFM